MGQFCAYHNPNPLTRDEYPYLLDVQTNLLSELITTVVIPLMATDDTTSIRLSRLNPTSEFTHSLPPM